ncbi:uncharacterized protein LOC111086447 [Limulus polyphemus]|uniref:Uncharacterized protein LOC111086447 n=1 Tax=Limulus polyphemus TaxID=6850 RepID=A0ABM1SN57_LIMPO|nr:uncharacterized protein LOC111086447 [Limulus polyphemus]
MQNGNGKFSKMSSPDCWGTSSEESLFPVKQVTKNSKYKQNDFRLQLLESLVKPLIESRGGPSCLSSIHSPVLVDAQERLSPGKHFPAFAEEKKRCSLCLHTGLIKLTCKQFKAL